MFEISGQRYEILLGTDVSRPDARNGYFIEMHALDSPGTNPFLFAFRSNVTKAITISAYRSDLPLEVLRYFIRVVEEEFAKWPIVNHAD